MQQTRTQLEGTIRQAALKRLGHLEVEVHRLSIWF
jgi:hypothetical protein